MMGGKSPDPWRGPPPYADRCALHISAPQADRPKWLRMVVHGERGPIRANEVVKIASTAMPKVCQGPPVQIFPANMAKVLKFKHRARRTC